MEHHMNRILSSIAVASLASATVLLSSNALAEAPELQVKAPFIYLADNLDESQKLGWCIDTVGAGFKDKLHAHSCKPEAKSDTDPRGNDIRFNFDAESGQISSYLFENKCMDLNNPEDESTPFGLVDCTTDESQKFVYEEEKGQIQIAADTSMCVVVKSESTSAGPFMSRGLIAAKCETTDEKYSKWIIKAEPKT